MARKEVNVKYITTQELVVNPFTKPIPKEAYFRHVKSLGLHRHLSICTYEPYMNAHVKYI